MQKTLFLILSFVIGIAVVHAQQHSFDPPWNKPPESSVDFTVAGVDNVPDLFGDITNPQLVIFFAGNQFMCVDSLLETFKKMYPQYQRIFAETLPPGVLAKQIEGGSITIGNMRITLKPDVYTAGRSRIEQMSGYLTDTITYAFNKLAIMVYKGNPKKILSLLDLGKQDIRVSMPNPETEGIGKRIEEAYVKAGGDSLKNLIMQLKVSDSSTYLTQIHHRETPLRIMYNRSDAGPVWYSEAYYQQMINHPIEMINIPDESNITAAYMAGTLKNAEHKQAAKDFIKFLHSVEAKAIFKRYGFNVKND